MASDLARVNELIAFHSPLAHRLTNERTSYKSQLIPVTSYILVACAETFGRYPDMIRRIAAAMPPEEIGRRGRRPGCQVNTVFLWSIANFPLVGRKVLTPLDPSLESVEGMLTVLDFWERVATGFRGDGTRAAAEGGDAVRVYDDAVIQRLATEATPVDDELRLTIKRFNATMISHLFLLYFDTRVGSGDTGPYHLGDGTTMIVRDYYKLSQSDFAWSDSAAAVPYRDLVAGFVLQDVSARITDFGTSNTDPEDYLDRLVRFSLFTTDNCPEGELRPVDLAELGDLMLVVRRAQATHYRSIATMTRDEMVACGAYVYFSFLRPFAEVAGVADELDWSVPRDLDPTVHELLVAVGAELGSAPMPVEDPETYYPPIAAR